VAIAILTAMAVLFGASFVATKHALATIPPGQLIFLRFSIAAVLFCLFLPFSPTTRIDRRGYLGVFLLASLEPGAYFFLEALGIQRTLASTASVLIATIPVFVLVIEAVVLKTRVVAREAAVILVSIAGIVLLLSAGGVGPTIGGTLAGNLLVLAAAFSASLYTALAPAVIARHSPLAVSRLQSFYATALYLPLALREWLRGQHPTFTWSSTAALLYLGVGCSFFGYILLNTALARARASLVGAFSNIIPVVATGLAVILLREHLQRVQLIGAIVVIGSLAALTWLQSRPRRAMPGKLDRLSTDRPGPAVGPGSRPPGNAT
jgi:drug/metabolite transporter (DMT)-like permease